MTKTEKNIWIFVIIALIVGFVIGYVTSGGFGKVGQAIKTSCPAGTVYNSATNTCVVGQLHPIICDNNCLSKCINGGGGSGCIGVCCIGGGSSA